MIIISTYRKSYNIEHDSVMLLRLGNWLKRDFSGKLIPGAIRFYLNEEKANGVTHNSTYDFVDNSNSVVVIDPSNKEILYTKDYIHKDTIDLLLQIQYDIVDNFSNSRHSKQTHLIQNINDSMHEVLCNWEFISLRNKKIESVLYTGSETNLR